MRLRGLHHCCRYTFASWALDGGRSVKRVQERLGHSSAELTLRTYTHLMPSGEDELDFLSESGPDQTESSYTHNCDSEWSKSAETFKREWYAGWDSNPCSSLRSHSLLARSSPSATECTEFGGSWPSSPRELEPGTVCSGPV
jgi:hypothetical protein